jgi:hypothetical protein
MKIAVTTILALLAMGSPWHPAIAQTPGEAKAEKEAKKADSPAAKPPAVKPLSKEQQDDLLKQRISGGMGPTFSDFANVFLVLSRLKLSYGVGLMTTAKEIAAAELQSPFPKSYEPTLRELLDAIALQTFSQWKYDPSGKFFQSDVKGEAPVADLAFFEFTKAERRKPYEVDLAKGWKSVDKGNWTMFVPPSFPVGLDIYEVGSYSADDKTKEAELLKQIPQDVALMWAKRASEDAAKKDLKPAKVGRYDAIYFDTMVPTQLGQQAHWRQWVFMVDDKCYFIVSTIFPKYEDKIYPDVEAMLKSFKIKR